VKTNKDVSCLSPHLPSSFRFLSGRGRAQGWARWRREVVRRQIVILVLKQILLLVLKIFLFIKIVFLFFVFKEKLVFQIKLILSAIIIIIVLLQELLQEKLVLILAPIKIIQLAWISSCGSSSLQPLLLLWGKPVGGALLCQEKLLLVTQANRREGSSQQKSDQVGDQVLLPLHS